MTTNMPAGWRSSSRHAPPVSSPRVLARDQAWLSPRWLIADARKRLKSVLSRGRRPREPELRAAMLLSYRAFDVLPIEEQRRVSSLLRAAAAEAGITLPGPNESLPGQFLTLRSRLSLHLHPEPELEDDQRVVLYKIIPGPPRRDIFDEDDSDIDRALEEYGREHPPDEQERTRERAIAQLGDEGMRANLAALDVALRTPTRARYEAKARQVGATGPVRRPECSRRRSPAAKRVRGSRRGLTRGSPSSDDPDPESDDDSGLGHSPWTATQGSREPRPAAEVFRRALADLELLRAEAQ